MRELWIVEYGLGELGELWNVEHEFDELGEVSFGI